MVGIPYLERLRTDPVLACASRVWPFETGFKCLSEPTIVHAEIYPSLLPLEARDHECKDAAQVRALAEYFCREDEEGRLVDLFSAPAGLTPEQLQAVVQEEGWILGIR